MSTTVFERSLPTPSAVTESLRSTRASTFWLDELSAPSRPRLAGNHRADLVIVGGGYTGLWTAVLAKEREPERRVVLLEAKTIGWAASGRNGGFCEASITHGEANARTRWPDEVEQLEKLGMQNLDEIQATISRYTMDAEFERTGTLTVAIEPHEAHWLKDDPHAMDRAAVQAEVNSPTYLAGSWEKHGTALVHPAKLAAELARVAEQLGVEIFEHSPVSGLEGSGPCRVTTKHGAVTARQVALATNVFPSLLKRNVLMTVPVYDYVLMSEPLDAPQMASIGWKNRQGLADMANQFHYYRLTADNRILFGGYDAVYYYGGRVRRSYEERPESFQKLASHFFTTFPQLEGARFSHRWSGAIDTSTRFCAFYGVARRGSVAYAAGFTGLGVGAARFAANVMLDKLSGEQTERTELRMVRERPLPFPPEPAASMGINATRWSLNQADHNGGKRNVLLKTLDALGLGFDS
jgi:glycine/D-amino acid oxidase-like deaminating enzyme